MTTPNVTPQQKSASHRGAVLLLIVVALVGGSAAAALLAQTGSSNLELAADTTESARALAAADALATAIEAHLAQGTPIADIQTLGVELQDATASIESIGSDEATLVVIGQSGAMTRRILIQFAS